MSQRSVLFVDDERGILNSLKRLFRREDFRVLTAGSGPEALEILEREDRIELIVSDQRMPDMEGTALLREVRDRSPDTIRVILSGYADAATIVDAINQGQVYRFLPKPWDDDELKGEIQRCLDEYDRAHPEAASDDEGTKDLVELCRAMEGTMEFGNAAMKLVYDMVKVLPVPMFTALRNGTVVFANEAASQLPLSVPIAPGGEVATLPSDLSGLIRRCLFEQEGVVTGSIRMGESSHQVYLDRLQTADGPAIGCAVAIVPEA